MFQPSNVRFGKILALLGLLFLLVSAGVPVALAQTTQLPLRGEFSGAGATFGGTATHLGLFSGVIDNSASPPNAVWTAANGDMLTNTTTSFVIDFTAPEAPTVFPYSQTIEFTGGTGRFQNSSGSATITGTIDLATLAYDGQITGFISHPNTD